MTKKDYIALADLIVKYSAVSTVRQRFTFVIKKGEFMHDLCKYLKEDNASFNEVKFREATGEILEKRS